MLSFPMIYASTVSIHLRGLFSSAGTNRKDWRAHTQASFISCIRLQILDFLRNHISQSALSSFAIIFSLLVPVGNSSSNHLAPSPQALFSFSHSFVIFMF